MKIKLIHILTILLFVIFCFKNIQISFTEKESLVNWLNALFTFLAVCVALFSQQIQFFFKRMSFKMILEETEIIKNDNIDSILRNKCAIYDCNLNILPKNYKKYYNPIITIENIKLIRKNGSSEIFNDIVITPINPKDSTREFIGYIKQPIFNFQFILNDEVFVLVFKNNISLIRKINFNDRIILKTSFSSDNNYDIIHNWEIFFIKEEITDIDGLNHFILNLKIIKI